MNPDTMYDEQWVIGALLASPEQHAWELSGLDPSLFVHPLHRLIVSAICTVRDSGQRFHWKRVRSHLRRRGHPCHADIDLLRRAAGYTWGVTAAISRMHARRARRVAA